MAPPAAQMGAAQQMHILGSTSDDRINRTHTQSTSVHVMSLAVLAIALLIVTATPQTATAQVAKNEFAQITTTVEGRIYIYRVTNLGTEPITRFEIPVYKVYNHEVPEGWDIQDSLDRFGSTADSIEHAIGPGETKKFSCRAASMTSVATSVTARIGFEDSAMIEMPGVWAPGLEKWHTLLIPPVVISLLAIAYALRRRSRARREADPSDPT